MEIYTKNNIGTLNPVNLLGMRSKRLLLSYYYKNQDTDWSLERFVEEELLIPIASQVCFWNGRRLQCFQDLFQKFYLGLIPKNEDLNIYFAVYTQNENNLSLREQISQMNLTDRISSVYIILPYSKTKVGKYSILISTKYIKKAIRLEQNIKVEYFELFLNNQMLK